MSNSRIRRVVPAWKMPTRHVSIVKEGFDTHHKKTRRDQFLEFLEAIIVSIDVVREPVPDVMTICRFCHRLKLHELGEQLCALVQDFLQEDCLKISRGTIVGATSLNSPSSNKNKDSERGLDTSQTKKGNQWYFGIKALSLIQSSGLTRQQVQSMQYQGLGASLIPLVRHRYSAFS